MDQNLHEIHGRMHIIHHYTSFQPCCSSFSKSFPGSLRCDAARQVTSHCYFCTVFALILLWLRPSLFPALRDPDKKVELSFRFLAELGCWTDEMIRTAWRIGGAAGVPGMRTLNSRFWQLEKSHESYISQVRLQIGAVQIIYLVSDTDTHAPTRKTGPFTITLFSCTAG